MDLDHDRGDLAYEVLSRYLEVSGDYGGTDVLPFYLVYRALVRAKVAAIKRAQSAADGHEAERYLATAIDLAAPRLHCRHQSRAVRQRQDDRDGRARRAASPPSERAPISSVNGCTGSPATARSGSGLGTGLYAAVASQKTYAALAEIADALLRNGQNALIDAAFLSRRDRLTVSRSRRLKQHSARFAILDLDASKTCSGVARGSKRREPRRVRSRTRRSSTSSSPRRTRSAADEERAGYSRAHRRAARRPRRCSPRSPAANPRQA